MITQLLLDTVYFNIEFRHGMFTFETLVSENAQIIFVVFIKRVGV